MKSQLLSNKLQVARTQVESLVKDLFVLANDIGKTDMAEKLDDLRDRIKEPFLFVICGEVKAGKSSFINALLGTKEEIAKVAPQPMTDTVQQILYGEKSEIIEINPYLKKIFVPQEILSEIAIVDTPGTNTIVDHHQEITERFVPGSDLVVFVFEAKNPYRQSAWDFFDYIHQDWKRKVIFVLQQKDLMPENDLQINITGVRDYAIKKGVKDPEIFAVSALQEQQGLKDESGFKPLFDYIQNNITGGKAAGLKIENSLHTAKHMLNLVSKGLNERKKIYEKDSTFRQEVETTIERHRLQANRQIEILTENLLAAYDKSTLQRRKELDSGISFPSLIKRAFAGMFSSDASTKQWLENFANTMQKDLTSQLGVKMKDGVNDLAESLQNMTQTVHLLIKQNTSGKAENNNVFFSEVADKRAAILLELQEAFKKFISHTENFEGKELFSEKDSLTTNLITGSGIAVIGGVLAAVTQVAVFDITGGILATLGFAFAGVSTSMKKRKFLKEYDEEISKGRNKLQGEIKEKLETYANMIEKRIKEQFTDLDAHLEREKIAIKALNKRIESLEENAQRITL